MDKPTQPDARVGAPSGALLETVSTETRWQEAEWFKEWERLAQRGYHGVIYNEADPHHPRYVFERGRP